MSYKPFSRLFKGVSSILIILVFTILSSAQTDNSDPLSYLNYFSKADGGNSTFNGPYYFIEPVAPFEKLRTPGAPVPVSKSSIRASLERRAFDLMNQQRMGMGLQPVIWNEEIARIARVHSESMALHGYFSHQGIDGLWVNERAKRHGLRNWQAIGENIAYNRGYDNPAAFAVERWLKSPAHRKNALNERWEESGIGVAIGEDGTTYYFTQVFMEKR